MPNGLSHDGRRPGVLRALAGFLVHQGPVHPVLAEVRDFFDRA